MSVRRDPADPATADAGVAGYLSGGRLPPGVSRGAIRTRLRRTPDGRRIDVSRAVAAPPDAAWGLLTDTARWPAWGPSVSAVACTDRQIRPGATGRVRVAGLWLPFEVTACEPYRWTWTVAGIPATGHRVDPADEGCRVAFEIPPLAAAYVPVCRRALGRIAALLG